jgi:hypothetical protein
LVEPVIQRGERCYRRPYSLKTAALDVKLEGNPENRKSLRLITR